MSQQISQEISQKTSQKAHQHSVSFMPVIVGGDIATYAIGREFHEEYGIKSICIATAPIDAISRSVLFDCVLVEHLTDELLLDAINKIARENSSKKILVLTNLEPVTASLNNDREQFESNVILAIPDADVVELVSQKDSFMELCEKFGLDFAKSEVVDLSHPENIKPCEIEFPVVAKPSYSPEYAKFMANGFKKVYYFESQSQLDTLWKDLQAAGFTGTFLVQELITGDDTYVGNINMYIDASGKCTMYSAAQVLLEDHAPTMLGNPLAMITEQVPQLWEKAEKMLRSIGYHGFANFDTKRDARTGRIIFFELNPRMGRSNYYIKAGGVNPMRICVEDMVYGHAIEPETATEEKLYTLVPNSLLKKYLVDPQLKARVEQLIREKRVVDPQKYSEDKSFLRSLAVEITELNQIRKFRKYYPEVTQTSF